MNEMAHATFFPTIKVGISQERGIIRVDPNGLQYIRILRSWATLIVTLVIACIFLVLFIWAITHGIRMSWISIIVYVALIQVVLGTSITFVKKAISRRAIELEDEFLQLGDKSYLPREFVILHDIPWTQVNKVRIKPGRPPRVKVQTDVRRLNFGVLFGGPKYTLFPYIDGNEAAKALREAVAALAPDAMESPI